MENWGRLITAMVTPFDEDLKVNYNQAIKLAKYLVEEGNTALVITGTTGEAPTLSSDEKFKLYKTIKENDIVLLYTGWDSNYGSEKYYYEHPVVSEELAKFLVMKKIKM